MALTWEFYVAMVLLILALVIIVILVFLLYNPGSNVFDTLRKKKAPVKGPAQKNQRPLPPQGNPGMGRPR